MKRHSSSDSLGGLMSICPDSTVDVDEHEHDNNPIYTRDFQTMLEEESFLISEKKRRLSVDQVKALEKNFEVENKLEPERKVKLAQELGLQPRQVAVWFQNRRARWKTKQLERDYGLLKANHDALNHKYESLQRQNQSLHNEIQELKSKLKVKISVKEEASTSLCETDSKEKCKDDGVNLENCHVKENERVGDFKDGSSDSDSSVILNEDNNCSPILSSSAGNVFLHHSPLPFLDNNSAVSTRFEFSDANKVYQNQTQLVKIEEQNFFDEESCTTLFSDDQAPTLHWYSNDDWN